MSKTKPIRAVVIVAAKLIVAAAKWVKNNWGKEENLQVWGHRVPIDCEARPCNPATMWPREWCHHRLTMSQPQL